MLQKEMVKQLAQEIFDMLTEKAQKGMSGHRIEFIAVTARKIEKHLNLNNAKRKLLKADMLFEKILVNHIAASELRDFYRCEWKKITEN